MRLLRACLKPRLFIVLLLFVVGMQLHAQAAKDAAGDAPRVDTSRADRPRKTSPTINEFVEVDNEPTWDKNALANRVKYPDAARRGGIEGVVVIRALIDTTGHVIDYRFDKRADEDLNSAALDAVLSTTFTPATFKGNPVEVWIQIEINFKLQ